MIRDALVEVFRYDLKEVSLGLASITDVEVSPDLHFARVFLSGLDEKETRNTVDALQNARGKVRRFLGQRIRLRYTPELDFKYDETAMRASRIESLLHEVARRRESRSGRESGDPSEETHHDEPDDES